MLSVDGLNMDVAAAVAQEPTAGQASSIEAVMRALESVSSAEADYTEEKHLASLTEPLRSRGELRYRAPGRLERRALEPLRETVIVDGNSIVYDRPDQGSRRVIDLDLAPELRAIAEAFRATLAGDLAALRRYYSVGFDGDGAGWQLTLVPLDERARRIVRAIAIEGRSAVVTEVLTTETDGDTTSMTVAYRH